MNKVSIIIPVYGVEPWLEACLDSVLAQTLREIEVICIDDASPDGCGLILDRYSRLDERIRVIHLDENCGQGYGRNRGLEEAAGTYVYFLDSDDMLEPEAMEQLYRKAEEEQLDGIFFDSRAVYDDAALEKRYASYPAVRKGTYPEGAVSGLCLFEAFIRQGEWTCYVQRQFWNRAFLLREGIRNPVRAEHEDEVFAFEAILAAKRVTYWKKCFFIRRYRHDSVVTSPPAPKNFHGYFTGLCCMNRFVHERGLQSEAIDRNLARIYEKLERFYPLMSERCDLAALFQEKDDRACFYFFETSRKAWLHYDQMSSALLEELRTIRHIYIYGAGVIAEQVFRELSGKQLVIDGFLVSRPEGNPQALHGRPVIPLREADAPREETLVVVAVTEGYRKEICRDLEARGLAYRYYRD